MTTLEHGKHGPGGWRVDPSAGVRLMPELIRCPRCGVTKGRIGKVRRGLCGDCRDSLTPAERAEWTPRKIAS